MCPHAAGHIAAFSAATLVVSSVFGSDSNAQAESLEQAVVDAFIANCVLNLPNLEKIRAASRIYGWKPISGDAAIFIGPRDGNAKSEAWMATEKATRFFIGISTGNIGVQPVVTCAVANPDIQQDAMLGRLQKSLNLKYLNDEQEAGQRYRSWTTSTDGYSVLVSFTSLQNSSSPGGTIAAAVKVR